MTVVLGSGKASGVISVRRTVAADWDPRPPAEVPGWFHHRGRVLELARTYRPRVCVELGTYMGASAIGLAEVVREWGGTIYCVDTWAAGTLQGPSKPGEKRCPWMVGECAKVLVRCGVSAHIRLIVAQTTEAAAAWQGPEIDWLYVDADHTGMGCASDLAAWWPHLKVGGIILGDDYQSERYPALVQAWDRFEREHGQRFTRDPNPKVGFPLIWGMKQ